MDKYNIKSNNINRHKSQEDFETEISQILSEYRSNILPEILVMIDDGIEQRDWTTEQKLRVFQNMPERILVQIVDAFGDLRDMILDEYYAQLSRQSKSKRS